MKQLLAISVMALFAMGCNNAETKITAGDTNAQVSGTDTLTTSQTNAAPALDSFKLAEGMITMRKGKLVIMRNEKLNELTGKEMMIHEIEANDNGEMIINDGKTKILFLEGMVVDNEDNILMMKEGKMMEMQDGTWVEKKL